MRAFPVMTRDTEMNELRQLRMGRPGQFKKFFDFVAMAFPVLFGKESVGLAGLVIDKFFEAHFHHVHDKTMRQTRDAIRSRPRRWSGPTRRHDQTLHPPRKILRHRHSDSSTHGMAEQMSGRNF